MRVLIPLPPSPQIEINPSKSLNELKEHVSSMTSLGSIPSSQQRVFYLGGELKNGGRSLEALGVGRHGVNVIHVHNTKPKSNSTAQRKAVKPDVARNVPSKRNNNNNRRHQPEVVDLATDDDDEVIIDDDDEVCIIDISD